MGLRGGLLAFGAVLVLVAAVAAAEQQGRRRSVGPSDRYPDPLDLQAAVRAEIRKFEQEKKMVGFEGARFRAINDKGPKAGSMEVGTSSGATGATGPAASPEGAELFGDVKAGGKPVVRSMTVQLVFDGVIGPKGDTGLSNGLKLIMSVYSGIPVTMVNVSLSHFGDAPKAASLRRRLLMGSKPLIGTGVVARVTMSMSNRTTAEAGFAALTDKVQDGTLTKDLNQFLGSKTLKLTSFSGGPDNVAVSLPGPSQCLATTCMACAGEPNCAWCATSNKCFQGDRDPDQACVPKPGKTSLFHHWVFNPTKCADFSMPSQIFSTPILVDPEHCYNKFKDADETDTDCGGSCKKACVRRTSGDSKIWTEPKEYVAVPQSDARFKARREGVMLAPNIVGENPVGRPRDTIMPNTVEVSSTARGAGFIPAEYHSVGSFSGHDEAPTTMITPTN